MMTVESLGYQEALEDGYQRIENASRGDCYDINELTEAVEDSIRDILSEWGASRDEVSADVDSEDVLLSEGEESAEAVVYQEPFEGCKIPVARITLVALERERTSKNDGCRSRKYRMPKDPDNIEVNEENIRYLTP